MSRRKRNPPAPVKASNTKARGKHKVAALATAPANDVADLEAAAEMLEAAVLREAESMREAESKLREERAMLDEERAMREAEESLAASLEAGFGDQAEAGRAGDDRSEDDAESPAQAIEDASETAPFDVDRVDGEQVDPQPVEAMATDADNDTASDSLEEPAAEDAVTEDPYAVLADYERRSFAHVVASADQVQAPGLWRGIAFRIGTRRLMSSITEVSEILPVLHHTSVPGTQPWLLGVVNVRGTLVPLVDLRGYIEGGRTPFGDKSRMLVARHGSGAIGLLVEEVLGQRNLTAENDPLKLENDEATWARFVPAHFDLDGTLWGVFSMAALTAAPDFLHAAA